MRYLTTQGLHPREHVNLADRTLKKLDSNFLNEVINCTAHFTAWPDMGINCPAHFTAWPDMGNEVINCPAHFTAWPDMGNEVNNCPAHFTAWPDMGCLYHY